MFVGTGTPTPAMLFRSKDGGKSWEKRPLDVATECEAVGTPRYTGIAVDPLEPNHIWAGLEVDGARHSSDGGETWSIVDVTSRRDIHNVAVTSGPPKTVFIMAASGSGPAARPGSDCIPGLPHRMVVDLVEMGFEKFIYDEIVESDTFFTKDYREKHRAEVEEFFRLAWPTHAKLPEFIYLCIARHNFEGTHRLGDVKAPTLVLVGEADTIGSNHIAQSRVLMERIPGAEMKVLMGQSHGFFWQAPDETNRVILDWVNRHRGALST